MLIIEDSDVLRSMLSRSIEKNGCKVYQAADDVQGKELAYSVKPHIIILDILLPGKDGFLLLEEFKKNPETKDIPVVVVTNVADPEWRKKCLDAGAADYLVKADYRLDQMVEKIRETCEQVEQK